MFEAILIALTFVAVVLSIIVSIKQLKSKD